MKGIHDTFNEMKLTFFFLIRSSFEKHSINTCLVSHEHFMSVLSIIFVIILFAISLVKTKGTH